MEECGYRDVDYCDYYGKSANETRCRCCAVPKSDRRMIIAEPVDGEPELTAENTVPRSTYEHAMGRIKEMEEAVKLERGNRDYWHGLRDYWNKLATSRLKTINCMKRQSKQTARDLCDAENRVKRLTSDNERWKAGKGIFRDKSLKLQDEVGRLESEIECKDREIRKLRIGCLGCDEVGRLELEIERLKLVLNDFHSDSFSMADKQMEDEIAVLKQNLLALTDIKDRWKSVALKRTKRISTLKTNIKAVTNSTDYWRRAWKEMHDKFRTADACAKIKQAELKEVSQLWEKLRISKEAISIEVDNLASIETRGRAITEVQDGS